jgi:hypothetical protein
VVASIGLAISNLQTGKNDMSKYHFQFEKPLWGLLQWEDWERLIKSIRKHDEKWHVHFIPNSHPVEIVRGAELAEMLVEINDLMQKKCKCKFMNNIYVDDLDSPSLIKIYENNEVACSHEMSSHRGGPLWILLKPDQDNVSESTLIPFMGLSITKWAKNLMGGLK